MVRRHGERGEASSTRQTGGPRRHRDTLKGVETGVLELSVLLPLERHMNLICHGPWTLRCWECYADTRPKIWHCEHSFFIYIFIWLC